jgi:hypothetical protein
VERDRAGELLRVGPKSSLAPRARRSQELCVGAAGVGARGGVHVRRPEAAAVLSGPCGSSPEEASTEKGKRGEGAGQGGEG